MLGAIRSRLVGDPVVTTPNVKARRIRRQIFATAAHSAPQGMAEDLRGGPVAQRSIAMICDSPVGADGIEPPTAGV
jgi:hypothetical protein